MCLRQNAVIDIGEVANAACVVAKVSQSALQDVIGQVGSGMAKVSGVIGRYSAGVHRDDVIWGIEGNDLLASSVVQEHSRRLQG